MKRIPLDTKDFIKPEVIILNDAEMVDGVLASYNPILNTIFVRGSNFNEESTLAFVRVDPKLSALSRLLACSDDHRSNLAHELGHWYHREYTRKHLNLTDREMGDIAEYMKMRAKDSLILAEGHSNIDYEKVGKYAELSKRDPEEVLAEAFVQAVIGRYGNDIKLLFKAAGYEEI